MPILPYPHLTLHLDIEMTYCDGAHADDADPMPEHLGIDTSLIYTIVPPGDFQPELGWPPVTEDEIWKAVKAALTVETLMFDGVQRQVQGSSGPLYAQRSGEDA